MRFLILITFTILFWLPGALSAQGTGASQGAGAQKIVYMQDGRLYTGRVVKETARFLSLRVKRRTLKLSKAKIKRITNNSRSESRRAREIARLRTKIKRGLHRKRQRDIAAFRRELRQDAATQRLVLLKEERKKQKQAERKIKISGLWRSLILPGWGQYHRGEKIKGGIFMGLFLGSGALWAVSDGKYRAVNKKINASADTLFLAFSPAPSTVGILAHNFSAQNLGLEKRSIALEASVFGTAFLGMYLVNLFDAVFFRNTPISVQAGLEFQGPANGVFAGWRLGAAWRMSW